MAIKLGTKPIELGEDSAVVEAIEEPEGMKPVAPPAPKEPEFTVEQLRFMLEQKLSERLLDQKHTA